MQTEGLLGGANPTGIAPNPTGMGLHDGGPQSRVGIAELLEQVLHLGASDLHLTAGARPTVRVNGRLGQLEDYPVLQPAETQAMIYSILTQRQRERLERDQELDCAHALPGKARFRLNVYFQRDSVGAAFRLIPQEIKPLEALGIPPQVSSLARLPRGFVLVTGPTGSGKSTTPGQPGRPGEPRAVRPHHDRGGPDRVPPRPQAVPGQPARGRRGHQVLRQRPQARPAPGPRHHPGRRARDLETISIALTAAETATWSSPPSTLRMPPRPSTGSLTSSRPTSSSRSECSWPAPFRAWSANS